MTHDPKLVKAMAPAVAARLCAPGQRPNYIHEDMARDISAAALTALCAHLRLTPEALRALADGEAVVVPREATPDMCKPVAAAWCLENGINPEAPAGPDWPNWYAQAAPYAAIYAAMLAASPYAREADNGA